MESLGFFFDVKQGFSRENCWEGVNFYAPDLLKRSLLRLNYLLDAVEVLLPESLARVWN
jgi:hypothetical protein